VLAWVARVLSSPERTEPDSDDPKKSPAPRFHAFSLRVRRELYEAYAFFVSAFRIAAHKLKAGDGAQIPKPR
jgi:hypothetical protein